MKAEDFATLIERFFADHLEAQRNLSPNTLAAYRDTFKLLLIFLASYHRTRIDQLTLDSLRPEAVLAFLEDLERSRGNAPRTRNVRLAAIRTFARFAISRSPASGFLRTAQRILAIPLKKSSTRLLGFLDQQQIKALLSSTDEATWSGRRDRLLFLLLYNTGARIAEALQIQVKDLQERAVLLHGKGRKERIVPLWPQTDRLLHHWCRANKIAAEQPIFTNRWGNRLSRDGVAHRLSLAASKATAQCPSLAGRIITPHTLRHTCAMHLLQSGVALEIIALWLGHEKPITTHTYIEADLRLKKECLDRLQVPPGTHRPLYPKQHSHLLAFLEAI